MTSFLLISQFILTGILTIAVLLQKSSSIGLGAYSGSNESLFGAKGPAGFMAKFTFVIGILFLLNTLTLGYFYNQTKVFRCFVEKLVMQVTNDLLRSSHGLRTSETRSRRIYGFKD